MDADTPLLPLFGVTLGLVGLVGALVFAIFKLRRAGGDAGGPTRDRLSEEAFAAATIQAALAGAAPQAAAAPGPASAADGLDAALLEALPAGLLATDEAGVVRRCTLAARTWLGIAGPGTGHPFRQTLAAWPQLADAVAGVHAGDAPAPFTFAVDAAPLGRLQATVVRWTPRSGRGGALAVLAPAAPDAADEPSAPDAANAGIPAAARLASGLAHELANSLTTVHGYAHMIDRSTLTPADRQALEHITSSSEKMLSTVEAFRALVRPLPVSPTTFAPVDAVRAAIDLARQETGRAEAVVTVTSAPTGTVEADRVLIEEAVAAVVRNAIEASAQVSPVPPVAVSVRQHGQDVSIVVADHGPGVPEDMRARVFQPFLTDKPGHDGLGLARAAQVLHAHPGASIALTHPADGGLVVTIALPRSA